MIQSALPAIAGTLVDKFAGGANTQSNQFAAVGALSERDALQLKVDSGRTLTPVEQGTFDRLSAIGQPEREQLYLAQQGVEYQQRTDIECTDPYTITDSFLSLFYTEPKTADNFTILNASPRDISDLNNALEYLQSTDSNGEWNSETAVDLLASIPSCASILMNPHQMTKANPETGMIAWDPRAANRIEGGFQSPALLLAHEIDHVVNFGEIVPTNDGYTNTEERRVITGSETQIAKDLGEPTRTSHNGNFSLVGSSTLHSNAN